MMEPTTLRWEWRTFGDGVDAVEALLHKMTPQVRQSEETYILSDRPDVNTKIRNSLLDIKTLEQVDAHGLELWRPAMKLDFPLTPAAIDAVLRLWGVKPRAIDRLWSLDAFLDRIVASEPSLVRADVVKTRRGFVVDDCLVELADLRVHGQVLRTAAVEMADPERAWRTVQALGLSSYENTNYVKALKRVLVVHHA